MITTAEIANFTQALVYAFELLQKVILKYNSWINWTNWYYDWIVSS